MNGVDQLTIRIGKLCYGLDPAYVQPIEVAMKVVAGIYDGVTTAELDNLAAETAASMTTRHPDYAILAARIAISSLHKNTSKSFSGTIKRLYTYLDPKTGENAALISKEVYEVVRKHAALLDSTIIYDRDYGYDYFGYKTLEKSYLLKVDGKIAERPQHMLMRVAVGIHQQDIDSAIETYNLLSERWFTHATPTLFNAGTPKPQLSSCFLLSVKNDSVKGMYDAITQCAEISQSAGGIGLSIHTMKAAGTYDKETHGISNGIVPLLKVLNETSRHIEQGGGKRKGSFAVYLEPWHADIFEFLQLKKNHGKEELRARNLFYALWVPDLFMKRVEADDVWSLFCPHECPGLADCYGEEFEQLYERYEREGRARRTVNSRALWTEILRTQIETGTPYMMYKDTVNRKSNQQNVGILKNGNLCSEVLLYTDENEIAVCNLASLSLPKFIQKGEDGRLRFDHQKLFEVTKIVVRNQNKIIDISYYPVEEARRSNMRHRPIGLGVQGLADAFILLRMPFESEEAKQLNKDIFETIYSGAMTASMELARKNGPYETWKGSPISKGQFQFDLWGVTPDSGPGGVTRWDWETLRQEVVRHGVRNSLLLAPMPTASTSQILGNNECFEPFTSNIYVRRVLSGEFVVVNKYLLKDLVKLGLWNDRMKNMLIAANGSVQEIPGIPGHIKELYKTVWEIKQKTIVDMAADRGAFICQSQSLNIHMVDANFGKLTSMHFHAWKRGLKTGMYYLRTKAAADAVKFTVEIANETQPDGVSAPATECLVCSS